MNEIDEERTERNAQRWIQIGLKIAYYRKLNKLTQEDLAEKVRISPGYVSQIEAPKTVQPISLNLLFEIADMFNIPPKKFFDFDYELE